MSSTITDDEINLLKEIIPIILEQQNNTITSKEFMDIITAATSMGNLNQKIETIKKFSADSKFNPENIQLFKQDYKVSRWKFSIFDWIFWAIREKKFQFNIELIINFFLSLLVKRFVILYGLSGTGKSQLPKLFAKSICENFDKQFLLIPVKSDWNDDKDLLGFYNPLLSTYQHTDFLDFLIQASNDFENPYFVCLDEMNLSHVEYYFSSFLSKMEDEKQTIHLHGFFAEEEIRFICAFENNEIDNILPDPSIKPIDKTRISYFKEFQTQLEKFDIKMIGTSDEEIQNHLQNNGLNIMEQIYKKLGSQKLIGKQEFRTIKEIKETFSQIFENFKPMIESQYNIEFKPPVGDFLKNIKTLIPGNLPPRNICFKNVFIIGTVNMDETTKRFSPKVLDRANVVEFEVDIMQLQSFIPNTDQNIEIWRKIAQEERITKKIVEKCKKIMLTYSLEDFNNWCISNGKDLIGDNSILARFFNETKKQQIHYGFRTRDEIFQYLYYIDKINLEEYEYHPYLGFDYQILQKLIPKIKGRRIIVEEIINNLIQYTKYFPKTNKKLKKMKIILEEENYIDAFL